MLCRPDPARLPNPRRTTPRTRPDGASSLPQASVPTWSGPVSGHRQRPLAIRPRLTAATDARRLTIFADDGC